MFIHYTSLPIYFHSNDFHTFSYYYFILPHFIDLVWTPSYSKCIKYIHGYSTTLHLSKYAEWCKSERQATYCYKFRPCKFYVLWSQGRGLWPRTCHFQVLTSPCNNLRLLSLKKRALMSVNSLMSPVVDNDCIMMLSLCYLLLPLPEVGPFYWQRLFGYMTWISNYYHVVLYDVMSYSCPAFNDGIQTVCSC